MIELILDVDTGVDDALAIIFAVRHPDIHLRAISCVAGNTNVDQVVANTLRVLDAAGADDVPVARGAAQPLIASWRDAHHIHGSDGMADAGLPPSQRRASDVHAVEMLRQQILSAPAPLTLVTLAPLTNIAVLLRMYPDVANHIAKVVVMGGSASAGNVTPFAEFNVWHDPEASEIVFQSGLPLTMYGLDVFYAPAVSRTAAQELTTSGDPGVQLAGRLLLHAARTYGHDERLGDPGGGGLGDAGAVCAAIDPAGFITRRMAVSVELHDVEKRGQTVTGRDGNPVQVALEIDGARYRDLFLSTILRNRVH